MERYQNRHADSGVTHYQIGSDSIRVRFRNGGVYTYTYERTGREHVEAMKRLAVAGRGLSTYISQQVNDAYAEKQ